MNLRSSRSHAIFTITLEQRRAPAPDQARARRGDGDAGSGAESGDEDDEEPIEDYLCAKMHLVDLAGARCRGHCRSFSSLGGSILQVMHVPSRASGTALCPWRLAGQ